jgi:hypothetical protein
MKNSIIKNFLFVFAFLAFTAISAQTISGVVTSEDGPLPGATVQVKGSNVGVTTDFDGKFSIQASGSDVLLISFVGFTSQEVSINNQDNLSITLQSNKVKEKLLLLLFQ